MTIVNDIRKTVTDTTPVYAAVGVTDLAVERLRDASARVGAVRLDVNAMQDKTFKRFEKVTQQVQHIPAQVWGQSVEVADKTRSTYSDLAVRGEKLVKRIRNQKATKDLFAQADSTVARGKGAVTTVRKAANDTSHAAKATLTTGRRGAEAVVSSVQKDVKATGRTMSEATSSTISSAKGTATTAKKATETTKSATKGVATSARKTAATASTATKTATPKVGD